MPVFGCLPEPEGGLFQILRNTVCRVVIEIRKILLRAGMSLLRGLLIPVGGFLHVLCNTVAIVIADAQLILRFRQTVLRGLH